MQNFSSTRAKYGVFFTVMALVALLVVGFNIPTSKWRFTKPTYITTTQNIRRELWRPFNIETDNVLITELKKCCKIDIKIKPYAKPRQLFNPVCRMDFLGYNSSKLELYMIDHVKEFQGKIEGQIPNVTARYCKFMSSKYVKTAVLEFVNAMKRYQNLGSFEDEKVNTDIFSTMTYRTICQDGATEVKTHYIEPLLGLTRHPYAICEEGEWLMNMDYVLLQSFEDNLFYKRMNNTEQIQWIGMDLGASYFEMTRTVGTGWLYSKYESKGAQFDKMLMWEGKKYQNDEIWKFPQRYTSSFQYFNFNADLDPNVDGHPLRVLHKIARHEDFVMLKLDIDTPQEIVVLLALLENPNALAVVDEFFFEHHTRTPLMRPWWGNVAVACQLSKTYDIFLRLRLSGVRAHGWP